MIVPQNHFMVLLVFFDSLVSDFLAIHFTNLRRKIHGIHKVSSFLSTEIFSYAKVKYQTHGHVLEMLFSSLVLLASSSFIFLIM